MHETHNKGCVVLESMRDMECEVREWVEKEVLWCGEAVKSKGKGIEGCAPVMSPGI